MEAAHVGMPLHRPESWQSLWDSLMPECLPHCLYGITVPWALKVYEKEPDNRSHTQPLRKGQGAGLGCVTSMWKG